MKQARFCVGYYVLNKMFLVYYDEKGTACRAYEKKNVYC